MQELGGLAPKLPGSLNPSMVVFIQGDVRGLTAENRNHKTVKGIKPNGLNASLIYNSQTVHKRRVAFNRLVSGASFVGPKSVSIRFYCCGEVPS